MQISPLRWLGTLLTPKPACLSFAHQRTSPGVWLSYHSPIPHLTFRSAIQALTTSTLSKFLHLVTSTIGPVSLAPGFRIQFRNESQSDSVVCCSCSTRFPSSHSRSYKPNAQNSEHPTQVAHREEISVCSFWGPPKLQTDFLKVLYLLPII